MLRCVCGVMRLHMRITLNLEDDALLVAKR